MPNSYTQKCKIRQVFSEKLSKPKKKPVKTGNIAYYFKMGIFGNYRDFYCFKTVLRSIIEDFKAILVQVCPGMSHVKVNCLKVAENKNNYEQVGFISSYVTQNFITFNQKIYSYESQNF